MRSAVDGRGFHNGRLVFLVVLPNFLLWFHLDGPGQTVTLRGDTLEVNNSWRRYLVPRARIVMVDYFDGWGVRVRTEEGSNDVWVGAFSSATLRGRRLSTQELRTNAKSLSGALFGSPVPADDRPVKEGYRWGYLLLTIVGAIAFKYVGALVYSANRSG